MVAQVGGLVPVGSVGHQIRRFAQISPVGSSRLSQSRQAGSVGWVGQVGFCMVEPVGSLRIVGSVHSSEAKSCWLSDTGQAGPIVGSVCIGRVGACTFPLPLRFFCRRYWSLITHVICTYTCTYPKCTLRVSRVSRFFTCERNSDAPHVQPFVTRGHIILPL